jgi:hypothetical protein
MKILAKMREIETLDPLVGEDPLISALEHRQTVK